MLKTIQEVLTLATQYLTDHHVDKPRRTSEDLLAAVLKMKRINLYLQFDRPLIETEMALMRTFLKRAITGEPIAYIIGFVEFLECRIQVTPDVLIPRNETEILADLVIKKIKDQPLERRVLWDLCTGSGCIGLGIKRSCPQLSVFLSDICPKAIALTKVNAINNHVDVECRLGDLLHPFLHQKADFVVCNPPYVSKNEFESLDRSVRNFEPTLALLAGDSGIDFYRRLSDELPVFLNPGAQVFFEIGHQQGKLVQEIFCKPPWRSLQIQKDWAGHDRFFFLEIE